MNNFTHLHVHTEYSVLDGLAKIPQLIAKAYNDGQRAIAITDHGNMYGVFEFVKEVDKFNKSSLATPSEPMKAIIGCEVYVASDSAQIKSSKEHRSGRFDLSTVRNHLFSCS
jgi:DNA polymerase-3 subunit alpha